MDSIRNDGGTIFGGGMFAVVTPRKKPKEPKEEEEDFLY